jgi:hypothetical protein
MLPAHRRPDPIYVGLVFPLENWDTFDAPQGKVSASGRASAMVHKVQMTGCARGVLFQHDSGVFLSSGKDPAGEFIREISILIYPKNEQLNCAVCLE